MSKVRKQRKSKKSVGIKPRGISAIGIMILIAILLLIGVGAYFFFGKTPPPPTESKKVTKVFDPNCSYNDPELCKFVNNWEKNQSYSIRATEKSGMTNARTNYDGQMFFSQESKSKFREIEKAVNGTTWEEVSDTIVIDTTAYYLDNNKVIDTVTYKPDDLAFFLLHTRIYDFDNDTALKTKATFTFVSKEPCGEQECLKYQVTYPETVKFKGYEEYLWFDKDEYLLRKRLTKEPGSLGNTIESTYSYEPVTITVPSAQ